MTGCYCRVSTDEQEKEGTIQTQIDFAKQYFELHEIKDVKWYLDDGVTGTIPLEDRPQGPQLLTDAQKGNLKTLYIYNIKRLGRSTRITLNALYELEKHGVAVISMTEPFDSTTPTGRYFITNLAAMAELDKDNIMQQTNDGKDRAARQGRWVGGCPPFGYIVRDGYLELYEPEAEVVRMIYTLHLEKSRSSYDIAKHLNSFNIPSWGIAPEKKRKNGSTKWTGARVRQIIKNTIYMGVSIHRRDSKIGRKPITRKVPAIIDQTTWEKAQNKLTNNQLEACRNRKYNYLLTGLIRCGLCGLAFSGTTTVTKGYRRGYYRCRGKHSDYKLMHGHKCPSHFVEQKEIESLVWEKCVQFIKNPGEVLKEIAAGSYAQARDIEAEIATAEKSLKEKENEKKRVLELYRKELIEFNDVQEQLDQIKKEKVALKKCLEELITEQKKEENKKKRLDDTLNILDELQNAVENADFETKRKVVKSLVKEIVVYPNEIKITFFFNL